MRNKYKIYSVILTGIILTGCKSVRMTSQDRQQFMPNGISIAQQLLEETGEATQAKSSEAIKTTPSANNTTSESRFLCRIEKNGYDRDYCADNILYHNLLGVLILLYANPPVL